MKNLKTFYILSSALVMAGSFYASTASVQAASLKSCMAGGLTKAECACEVALEKGTKQAIRDFLKLYPRSKTACSATAFVGPTDLGDENDAPSRNKSTTVKDDKTPTEEEDKKDDCYDDGYKGPKDKSSNRNNTRS